MFDNPRMSDPDYLAVWVWLLLQAKHTPKDAMLGGKRITVLYGQLTTGRKQVAECTGVNESKVDRILKLMESEQQIEQQITSTNRLISITNYEKYQDSEHQNEQRVNNDRTTSEQRVNTSKELKNLRIKEKKDSAVPAHSLFSEIIRRFGEGYEAVKKVKYMDYRKDVKTLKQFLQDFPDMTIERFFNNVVFCASDKFHTHNLSIRYVCNNFSLLEAKRLNAEEPND